MEFIGNISDAGKLIVSQTAELGKWLMSHRNKNVSVVLKVKGRNRSNPQNNYYWGVIISMVKDAMNDFGNEYTSEEVHEFLKKEFNWEEKEMKEGYFVKVPRSTTRLNTIEFNDYKEKIQQFAAEVLGIYVPDPNEGMDDGGLIVAGYDKEVKSIIVTKGR